MTDFLQRSTIADDIHSSNSMLKLGDSEELLTEFTKLVLGQYASIHKVARSPYKGYQVVELERCLSSLLLRKDDIPAELLDVAAYVSRPDLLGLQLVQASPPGVFMLLDGTNKQCRLYIPPDLWQHDKQTAAARLFFGGLPAFEPPSVNDVQNSILRTNLAALRGRDLKAFYACDHLQQLPSCLSGERPRLFAVREGRHVIFQARHAPAVSSSDTAATAGGAAAAMMTAAAAAATTAAVASDMATTAQEAHAAELPEPDALEYAAYLCDALQLMLQVAVDSTDVPRSDICNVNNHLAAEALDLHNGCECGLCNTFVRVHAHLISMSSRSHAAVWCKECYQLVQQLVLSDKLLFTSPQHKKAADKLRKQPAADSNQYRTTLSDALRLHEVQRLQALINHVKAVAPARPQPSMLSTVAAHASTVVSSPSPSEGNMFSQLPFTLPEVLDVIEACTAGSHKAMSSLFQQVGGSGNAVNVSAAKILQQWLSVDRAYLRFNPESLFLSKVERSMEDKMVTGVGSSSSTGSPNSPAAMMASVWQLAMSKAAECEQAALEDGASFAAAHGYAHISNKQERLRSYYRDAVDSIQQCTVQQQDSGPPQKKQKQDCPEPMRTGGHRVAALVLHAHSSSDMLLGSTLPVRRTTLFMGKPGSWTYGHVDLNAAIADLLPVVMCGYPLRLDLAYADWWCLPPLAYVYLLLAMYAAILYLEVQLGLRELPYFAEEHGKFQKKLSDLVVACDRELMLTEQQQQQQQQQLQQQEQLGDEKHHIDEQQQSDRQQQQQLEDEQRHLNEQQQRATRKQQQRQQRQQQQQLEDEQRHINEQQPATRKQQQRQQHHQDVGQQSGDQQQDCQQQQQHEYEAAVVLGEKLLAALQARLREPSFRAETAEWCSVGTTDSVFGLLEPSVMTTAGATVLRMVVQATCAELMGQYSRTFVHLVGEEKWVEMGGVVIHQHAFQRVRPYPGFKHAVENLLPNLKVSIKTAVVADAAACVHMQQQLRFRMGAANVQPDYMHNQQLIIDTGVQLAYHLGLH